MPSRRSACNHAIVLRACIVGSALSPSGEWIVTSDPSAAPTRTAEIPLSGELAEFRTALREEIEAARRAASSSAVPLVNGRRIGQGAFGHQYLFIAESALNVPDGAPGDLIVPDQPPL